ncbi:HD domain-containing protein 2 [Phlyctochytrium planicorne]|nr:HD domain-containing protein 2 [Phlyctochytrium planicorne]
MSTTSHAQNMLQFLLICGKLKQTKRTGWVLRKVSLPESISDHMHRMGVMALAMSSSSASHPLNQDRCIKIAIVHDLAEAIVGDITPHCNVTKEDKRKMEEDAMKDMVKDLGDIGKDIYELWLEYEEARTNEALFVKDLDKLEMIVQAYEYETSQNMPLQEFFDSTRGKFKHPLTAEIAQLLLDLRSKNPALKGSTDATTTTSN